MRGLTAEERRLLLDCCAGAVDSEATDREREILVPVCWVLGRLRIDTSDPDRDHALTTDLGRLALRCCPVEEGVSS